MQRDQHLVADRKSIVLADRQPIDSITSVFGRPWVLEELRAAMVVSDRRRSRGMVGMSMRDQHIAKPGVMCVERASKFLEVARLTDTRIDQNGGRVLLDQEIGVIAVTGHRARVVRIKSDWIEHEITQP
jgi:hypothetical protein